MQTLTDRLKQRLWDWYGTPGQFAEWDGRTYGGGKISQRFWEYFIAVELLDLSAGDIVLDIGGGSPATGLSMFPRLLASVGVQVVVLDVNFGGMAPGSVENVRVEEGLADRARLSQMLGQYMPTHVSCVSVLEHASTIQQHGIFEALEDKFGGKNAVFTFEFHETETHFEQQLTTSSLSAAVHRLKRYYLDRIERAPLHCVNALSGKDRLWYPLALRFARVH